MSSTDPTTIGVHRALHEALIAAREAQHRLDNGDATPDLDDLVELSTLLAGLSESVTAVNSGMIAKARARARFAHLSQCTGGSTATGSGWACWWLAFRGVASTDLVRSSSMDSDSSPLPAKTVSRAVSQCS